jgi:hypothetical protein
MRAFSALIIWMLLGLYSGAADEKPRGPGGNKQGGARGPQRPPGQDSPTDDIRAFFKTEVPPHLLDVVLGRPSLTSVTASILAYESREGMIEYGTKGGATLKTGMIR